jgi:hypothetical protein
MMEELSEYRKNLVDQLSAAAQEFRAGCLAVKDPFAPIAGGWNVHQLAAHVRDVDLQVYGARAWRTLHEQNPLFTGFDGDTYMKEHYDPREPLGSLLDEFAASFEKLAGALRGLPDESWTRESRHVTNGGGLTLQLWVERGLQHVHEHLATVKLAG